VGEEDLSRFRPEPLGDAGGKLKGTLVGRLSEVADDELLAAVVEVVEPGYVPAAVERRAAISERLFTANVRKRDLPRLARDPRVTAIEPTERLGLIE
jgi:hypothetical protein